MPNELIMLVFGYPNPKGDKVSDYLSALGINLLKCALSAFEVLVTVSSHQPAYRSYVNYLPAYMSAHQSQERKSVLVPFHPLNYPVTEPLVLTHLPDVSVSFASKPSAEIVEAIHAAGGYEQSIQDTPVFIIPKPSSDLLRLLDSKGAIKTCPAANETANLQSLGTLALVRRIFSSFFRTHQYPAFIDKDHREYTESHWMTSSGYHKRGIIEGDDSKTRKRARVIVDGTMMEGVDDDETPVQDDEVVYQSEKIIWALPPTFCRIGWGGPSELPDGDGLFVRYHDETQNGRDEKMVTRTIVRYFAGALGESSEAVRNAVERINRDMGVLKMTDAGKELAHLAKCIDTGLQAQARIFPIVHDGQYLGCVLLGSGFEISAYGSVYVPEDRTPLHKRMENASSHKSSLYAIANIVDPDNDSEESLEIRGCSTIIQLRKILLESNTNAEDRDKILAVAPGLRFGYKSWNVSSTSISDALRLIQYPDSELPDTFPLHPTKLFDTDRVSMVWSAFGELAPTCSFKGGPEVSLDNARGFPKHVGFRMVALKDALVDLNSIFSTKKFTNCNANRRAGPYKDRLYTGIDAQKVLSALAAASGAETSGKSAAKSKAPGNVSSDLFDGGF